MSEAIVIAQLNTDGTLDKSFSNTGKITINLTEGDDLASGIVIQPNGKIVVSGESYNETLVVLRFKRNGKLDSSYRAALYYLKNDSTGETQKVILK